SFFFSSRRRHTRFSRDWSSDVCSSDLTRYAINSWGILYLQEARGYSLPEAGSLLMVNTLAGIAGAVAFGFVSDKLFDSRRPPAKIGRASCRERGEVRGVARPVQQRTRS